MRHKLIIQVFLLTFLEVAFYFSSMTKKVSIEKNVIQISNNFKSVKNNPTLDKKEAKIIKVFQVSNSKKSNRSFFNGSRKSIKSIENNQEWKK